LARDGTNRHRTFLRGVFRNSRFESSVNEVTTLPEVKCPSCGTDGQGRYCAECGERFLCSDDFELSHFLVKQLPEEFLHVDGKLPRTLRLLFARPGALAKNYVAGMRQPFVGPLRIYIVLFLAHAIVAVSINGLGASFLQRVREIDAFGILSHLMSGRPDVNWQSPDVASRVREFGHWLGELATLLVFLATAALQKLIFYRLHRRYLEHVVLGLNVASFFLATLTVSELLVWAATRNRYGNFEDVLQTLIVISALPLYWYFAIRRFYGLKTLVSAGAAIVVTASQAAVAVTLNTVVFAILIHAI
jgi:hypothetical protein